MSKLPFELIEDILHRLPVKSLKRFRCVAKKWCLLIDNKSFSKLHLHHSLITNSHRHLIIGGLGVYSVYLDSPDKAYVIKPPFYYRSDDWISNSINGLVLVTGDPLVLWNPFSADYKALPKISPVEHQAPPDTHTRITYGFGHASKNDDYKVVRVVEHRNNVIPVLISSKSQIYSLRSNSWRNIEDFPYPLPLMKGSWRVHVDGALHTLMIDNDVLKIMAFSVETEKHYEVVMPDGIHIRSLDLTLDMINGYLCLICVTKARVALWMMKEYGVKESWTKLLSLSRAAIEPGQLIKPLAYSKDGKKLLLSCDEKQLVWYDFVNKTVDTINIDGMPFMFYAEFCAESLVPLNPSVEVKKPGPVFNPLVEVKKRGPGRKKLMNKRDDFLSEGFTLKL